MTDVTLTDLAAELRRLLHVHKQEARSTNESLRGFELAVQHAERIAEEFEGAGG